jgi:hypothetical protein
MVPSWVNVVVEGQTPEIQGKSAGFSLDKGLAVRVGAGIAVYDAVKVGGIAVEVGDGVELGITVGGSMGVSPVQLANSKPENK